MGSEFSIFSENTEIDVKGTQTPQHLGANQHISIHDANVRGLHTCPQCTCSAPVSVTASGEVGIKEMSPAGRRWCLAQLRQAFETSVEKYYLCKKCDDALGAVEI